jgi:hypothetical protein
MVSPLVGVWYSYLASHIKKDFSNEPHIKIIELSFKVKRQKMRLVMSLTDQWGQIFLILLLEILGEIFNP